MARFSRTSDIYLYKYLKTIIMFEQPGFRGSFRDMLNLAEKLGCITDAERWISIKEIRNIQAHEYSEDSHRVFSQQHSTKPPLLLNLKKNVSP